MPDDPAPEDRFADIVPEEEPAHVPGEQMRDEFALWHLPRKHHVRVEQWARALRALVKDIPDRTLINYLGLPGEDLLDLEMLAKVCGEEGRKLKYLGFDTGHNRPRSPQRVLAEHIVQRSGAVDANSTVMPDNITIVANPRSVGSRRVRDGGSFDVVNLDMCDAFTSDDLRPVHSAVLSILTQQVNRRGEPWLFFLTTRCEVERFGQDEVAGYRNLINDNIMRSSTFRSALCALLGVTEENVGSLHENLASDDFRCGKWLSVGIGKWLMSVTRERVPWHLSLVSAVAYRAGLMSAAGAEFAGRPPNLVSLVFRFERSAQPVVDPIGLGRSPEVAVSPDEITLAENLVLELNHIIDLDCRLQEDPDYAALMFRECAAMLAVRNYSGDAYREWVERLPTVTCAENA